MLIKIYHLDSEFLHQQPENCLCNFCRKPIRFFGNWALRWEQTIFGKCCSINSKLFMDNIMYWSTYWQINLSTNAHTIYSYNKNVLCHTTSIFHLELFISGPSDSSTLWEALSKCYIKYSLIEFHTRGIKGHITFCDKRTTASRVSPPSLRLLSCLSAVKAYLSRAEIQMNLPQV